jgi:hypothetical protein
MENQMARPKSGREPKAYHRRTPNWCPELTTLVEEAAQLIRTQHIFFTRSLDFGDGVNIAGVVQGVLIAAAAEASTVTVKQWATYIDAYSKMQFPKGEVKGFYFDDESLESFSALGQVLQTQKFPDDVKLSWGKSYRMHVVIALALEWFVNKYRNSQ